MDTKTPFASTASRQVLIAGAAWMLLYAGARLALQHGGMEAPSGVVLALVPAPAFVWFVVALIGAFRQADELERRVQLEALAFAFPAAMLLLMTLGLLELVIELPRADLSYRHVWAFLPPLYFLGVALAWRKYR